MNQGLLHVEVFQQRLLDEFGLEGIVTPPKVPYKITYLTSKSNRNARTTDAPTTEIIEDLSKWPGQGIRFKVEEPVVDVSISNVYL
jgi:GTP-binding protein LepA